MKTLEYIAGKLVSGRFILTVIAGFTFAYLSCKQILPAEQALTTIAIIVTFYFTKGRNDNDNGGSSNNGSDNRGENINNNSDNSQK